MARPRSPVPETVRKKESALLTAVRYFPLAEALRGERVKASSINQTVLRTVYLVS